jgi:hypothetical protein
MTLAVHANPPALLSLADAFLGAFESPSASAQFTLFLNHGPVGERPAGMENVPPEWEGMLHESVPCASWRADHAWHQVIPRRMHLTVEPARRTARLRVQAGAESYAGLYGVIPALMEFLGQTGQHIIHAAGLELPSSDPRGLLLSAPSGYGKTTTALALTRGGMRLLADDAVIARASPDGISVWGLPRSCKVHRKTLELLPWLAELPMSDPGGEELLLRLSAVTEADPRRTAALCAIFFLSDRNPSRHRISPLPKLTALTRLARENVRTMDPDTGGTGARAFQTLGELVRRCDTWLLSVGPRLDTLHEAVLKKVEK